MFVEGETEEDGVELGADARERVGEPLEEGWVGGGRDVGVEAGQRSVGLCEGKQRRGGKYVHVAAGLADEAGHLVRVVDQ